VGRRGRPLKKDLELLLKPISEAVAVSKGEKKPKFKNARNTSRY